MTAQFIEGLAVGAVLTSFSWFIAIVITLWRKMNETI